MTSLPSFQPPADDNYPNPPHSLIKTICGLIEEEDADSLIPLTEEEIANTKATLLQLQQNYDARKALWADIAEMMGKTLDADEMDDLKRDMWRGWSQMDNFNYPEAEMPSHD